jgi:cobalt-zinc-cadmium efflux system membrane fusion protein
MLKNFRTSLFSIALIGIIAIVSLPSCGTQTKKQPKDKDKYIIPDTLLRSLRIDTVITSQLLNTITLTGKVGANEDNVIPVYSMVSGVIQDVKVMLGDYVKTGQVLATVRSSEMAGYGNELVSAQTNLRVAELNLQKVKDMYKGGLASLTDSLGAETAVLQAKSELNRIDKVLQINGGNNNGDFVVKAPISGFIVQKAATNNMAIRGDNSTSLFTISDLNNVWIQANVYESNIGFIHLGEMVSITTLAYPNKVFQGKIDKVMNVLDPSSKVMKVRIVLPNPGYLLKPEMYASITITNKENKQCLSIPTQALVFDHNQYYVLVFKSKDDIKITPVQPINTVGEKTFIASGVNAGDRVISSEAILIYEALNS